MKTRVPLKTKIHISLVAAAVTLASTASAAEQEGTLIRPVDKWGFPPPIPVFISGFSASAATILKHDLIFMGFTNVTESEAQFLIRGSNGGGRVEGRVIERVNNNQVLGKAFTGSNERLLVHTLADAIAEQLTDAPGIARTKIAFRTDMAMGKTEIYVSDYDGFNSRAITSDGTLTTAPCWAGRDMLFYSSYKFGTPKIYFHQLSTGKRGTMTPFAGSNISPAVSPDGKKLAMILSKSGSPDLWVADIDGANLKRLTTTREAESSPCWSPDSKSILFASQAGGPARLFTIPVSGGTMRPVRHTGAPSATEPDWSPDGKWIVFTTLFKSGFQIGIVPATGGNAEFLVMGEDPSWAPNSRALIYCYGPDRNKRLSLLDVPTKQVKDIARISMSNSQPNWAE